MLVFGIRYILNCIINNCFGLPICLIVRVPLILLFIQTCTDTQNSIIAPGVLSFLCCFCLQIQTDGRHMFCCSSSYIKSCLFQKLIGWIQYVIYTCEIFVMSNSISCLKIDDFCRPQIFRPKNQKLFKTTDKIYR